MKKRQIQNQSLLSFFILTLAWIGSGCALQFNNPATSGGVSLVTVEAVYSSNGSNWAYWVENNGSTIYDADDTACDADELIDGGTNDGTYSGRSSCLHGGEIRKIELPNETSCNGLAITETLNVFNWTCVDSIATTTFFSTGIQTGKGLSDLVTTTGFIPNSITITKDGATAYESELTSWWTNTIHDISETNETLAAVSLNGTATGIDNGASGVLDAIQFNDPGAILVVGANYTSVGFHLDSSNTSIIVKSGATLSCASSGNDNVDSTTGQPTSTDYSALITGGSVNYLWFEGHFSGASSCQWIFGMGQSHFATLRNITLSSGTHNGMNFYQSDMGSLTNSQSYDHGWTCVALGLQSDYWIVKDVETYSCAATGLFTNDGSYHLIQNFTVTRTSIHGVHMINGYGNVLENIEVNASTNTAFNIGTRNSYFTNLRSVGNGAAGIAFAGANSVLSHFTSSNNNGDGLTLTASGSTVSQGLTFNNQTRGITVFFLTRTYLSNVAALHNAAGGIGSTFSDYVTFTDNLIVGNNSVNQCSNSSTNTNISTDGGFICGGDDVTDNMTVQDHDSVSVAASFVGNITSDSANVHDATLTSDGEVTSSLVTDWKNFSNDFRFWVRSTGTAITGSAQRNHCVGANECRVFDISLSNSDDKVFNNSEDGSTSNDPFTAGSCPAAVHGDYVMTRIIGTEVSGDSIGNDNGTCERKEICRYELNNRAGGNNDTTCDGGEQCENTVPYLVNAVEIMSDDIGNDNGLCESNESCIYSPNFGAYQGHGGLDSTTCAFTDGVTNIGVTGVTMYQHQTNGY